MVGGWADQGQQGGSAVTEVKQMDKWMKGAHMHEGPLYRCIIQNKITNSDNLLFSKCLRDPTKGEGKKKQYYICCQYE